MAILRNTTFDSTGAILLSTGSNQANTISKVERFTTVGTTTWTCPVGVNTIEVLVVAGGGGGGANHAGGGGGGGVVYNANYGVIPGTAYTIVVGAGGAGSTGYSTTRAGWGGNTQFNDLIAKGGGPGGNRQDSGTASLQYGYDGGCGGGAGGLGADATPRLWAGGRGVPGQGYNGGRGTFHAGGGGGGAGAPGLDGRTIDGGAANTFPGNGGDGYPCAITGTLQYYGGGGGGGGLISGPNGGRGGLGGGGSGGGYSANADEAGVNGLGGGGGGGDGGGNPGSNGGSGTVIIRYIDPYALAFTNAGYTDNAEVAITHSSDSNYRTMKSWVARQSGTFDVHFAAYIQSGTYYWAYRIRKNGTTDLATGYFGTTLDTSLTANGAAVHSYRHFKNSATWDAGDIITLEMVSSTGGGAPVVGVGQVLYCKELRVSDNTSYWTCPAGLTSIQALLVAGGGGSGGGGQTGYHGGGGGGGGVIYNSNVTVVPGTTYAITVGAGGKWGIGVGDAGYRGGNGGNTVAFGLAAIGGGGGGGNSEANGATGGSGGGGNLYGGLGGAGTAGQGFAGGAGMATYGASGGGGGAGSAGTEGVLSYGGAAGRGLQYDISGVPVFYGGGGAGAGNSIMGSYSAGGTPAYSNAVDNTGAGGGGQQSASGRRGGSGIVIIRSTSVPVVSQTEFNDGVIGTIRFNAETKLPVVVTGVGTTSSYANGLGMSSASAAESAWAIKRANPAAVSGYYWIQPPGGFVARYCYCDFDYHGGCWVLVQSVGSSSARHGNTTGDDNLYTDSNGRSYVPLSGAGYTSTDGRRYSDAWVKALGEVGEGVFRLDLARNGARPTGDFNNTYLNPSTDWKYTAFVRYDNGLRWYNSTNNGGESDKVQKSIDISHSYPFVWETGGVAGEFRLSDSNYRVFDFHGQSGSPQSSRYGQNRFLWQYPGNTAFGIYGGTDSFTGNSNGNPGYMWIR